MSSFSFDPERARQLLCDLENTIRQAVLETRHLEGSENFADIAEISTADTIYAVDKISEEAILSWFASTWPREWPVRVIMEGIEDDEVVVFPEGADPRLVCLLDPIDGTRNIMYDKRSAWIIGGLGLLPEGRPARLRDLTVAAMTELPPTKQTLADQISGVRGCGPEGLVRARVNLLTGESKPFPGRPSQATDCRHGFASLVKFFPEGKGLIGHFEEELWQRVLGTNGGGSPLIFDDQYITSAGQFYEILVGHDRFLGDLRPLVLEKIGQPSALVCHPYDVCTAFLLEEAGAVVEDPFGEPLDGPLDTVSPIAWVGYANPALAAQIRPVLQTLIGEFLR